MEQILIQNAQAFALKHHLRLAERLGFGIHGIIFAAVGNPESGATAVKAHRFWEPYIRELAVYERLREAGLRKILGFNVPQLLRQEDDRRVFEMSIVTRPFVLDFAGAYLDAPPEFPDELWADWESEKREQFDLRWPQVQLVLGKLKELGIHMMDVSPSNIAFLE